MKRRHSGDAVVSAVEVFSPHLCHTKRWYALNTALCGSKPGSFVSAYSKDFKDDYKEIMLDELHDGNGERLSYKYFSSIRPKPGNTVHVATSFGLLFGLLRHKKLEGLGFLQSREFLALVEQINMNGFGGPPPTSDVNKEQNALEKKVEVLQKQLASAAEEIIALRLQIKEFCYPLPDTPPSTPRTKSAPIESPPTNSPLSRSTSTIDLSETISQVKQDPDLSPKAKKKKIEMISSNLLIEIKKFCSARGEDLGSVLSECALQRESKDAYSNAMEALHNCFINVSNHEGAKAACSRLIPDDVWQERIASMRSPDYIYLLFKLKTRLSDQSWQQMINLTKLGRTGKNTDEGILPVKNSIIALRQGVFAVTQKLMGMEKLDQAIPGYSVDLKRAVVWIVRELRLHGHAPETLILNIKVDGRPFFAITSQLKVPNLSTLCPLLIAKKLVTLDLKGLVLILAKPEDDDFELGGRGLEVEFCLFCMALRACNCDLGKNELCLDHFLQTKANIGGFKGMRDDLTCLLDEDLSSLCLCALHCEMRNTEQLLKSIGLLAYKIGSLDNLNTKLYSYGPENAKQDRVTVKIKPGQTTEAERNNMSISSCAGSTERKILDDIAAVVEESLPHDKLKSHYKGIDEAKTYILNKLTICSSRHKYYSDLLKKGIYVRDFGTREEEILLAGSVVGGEMEKMQKLWKEKEMQIEKKFRELYVSETTSVPSCRKTRRMKSNTCLPRENDKLSDFAAELTTEFMIKVLNTNTNIYFMKNG
ncbi:hypothetical protein AC249_AIPGENE18630 [Exaiptasia diaphana]|nr:hypothetical protein AC249_AIPGENE18630 [Exaiptasia diaphana]